MTARLGIAVGRGELRAALVRRGPRGVRVIGVERVELGAGRSIGDALAQVAASLGAGGRVRIGVAPAPSEAWVKLLSLPPLSPADRARLLETEAERYFPVRGEPVIVEAPQRGPVAAARAEAVEALVSRVEESLGPVASVHPAPVAAPRAWAALDRSLRGATYAVVSRTGGSWELLVARGAQLLGHARLRGAAEPQIAAALGAATGGGAVSRVILAGDADTPEMRAALEGDFAGRVDARAELAGGVPAEFAPAVGLAIGPPGGLLPATHRARLAGSRRRRTGGWLGAVALAGSLFLATGPWDRAQSRAALAAEAERLAAAADTAASLLERARESAERIGVADSLAAARSDWLGMLEELTRRLPEGAHLTQLRADAGERTVEIRGYAGKASEIVQRLEDSALFSAVEAIEPVTRREVGGVSVESFAIRLQVAL